MPLPEYGTDNSDNFVRFIYFEIKKIVLSPLPSPNWENTWKTTAKEVIICVS